MRIDQDCLPERVSCSGELAQDQRSAVSRTGCDILLRHEVHTVAERCHEHDVGSQVESHHFLHRIAVVEVADSSVLDGVVRAVDTPDGALHLFTQEPVLLHPFTAGAGDLDEGGVLDLDQAVGE